MPQLALSHETSSDGKTVTIKLRPGVKFHDGEPLDAEAAKYSLDRHLTMKGSFRKPELGSVDKVEVVDPLTIKLILKEPFSPLLAQLTDRAGMMVSPKAAEAAGDKFGLKPVCAGPFKFVERVQQDRIVVEKFADYWNKDNIFIDKITYLPIVDGTVRLANLRSGGLDLIERVLATDIKTVRDNPKLKLISAVELGYQGITMNLANGPKADTPFAKDARVRRAFELSLDRDAINQVVFNGEFVPGNQWINPTNSYYQQAFPVPKRDLAKAKALLEGGRCHNTDRARLHGAQRPRKPRGRRGRPVDGGRSRLRPQDPRHRVRHLAEARRGRRVPALPDRLERPQRSRRQLLRLPDLQCAAEQRQVLRQGGRRRPRRGARQERLRPSARRPTRSWRSKFLTDGSVLYLYHRRVLVALSDKVEGYKQMPDGLVRVVGVKLK